MTPRIKESGVGSTSTTYVSKQRVNTNCPVTNVGGGSVVTARDYKRTYGVDIPNYYARKKRGELLPMTPFSQWEESGSASGTHGINQSNVSCKTYPNFWCEPSIPSMGSGWFVAGPSLTCEAPDPVMKVICDNQGLGEYAVQAAAAKLQSAGWDALTFAAELNKTLSMFRNALSNLNRNLSRGYSDKMWLEARYGWRQLFFDMKDIEKALSSINDGRKRYREAAGSSMSWTESGTLTTTWASCTQYWPLVNQITLNARGTVVADYEPPRISLNPIKTGWELITLSFVVDWFVNVGQWIDSMTFLVFSSQYTAAQGFQVQYSRTVTSPSVVFNKYYSGSVTGQSQWDCTLQVRYPCSVPLTPLVKLRLDASKVADLLAILKRRLLGGKRIPATQLLSAALTQLGE